MPKQRENPWPKLWAENDILLNEARRIAYLVNVSDDGRLACKACGAYVPWEPPELHFRRHQAELDRYLARKHGSKREPEAEGFYPEPCESCGNQIPRTGKPGRPPSICESCKYPLANLSAEEIEVLAEYT